MIPKDPHTIEDRKCADLDPEEFFPIKADVSGVNAAKRVCVGCPALDVCLEWAMSIEAGTGHTSRFGVYGGMTGRQRAELAARRAETNPLANRKPISHGTDAGYTAHKRRGEEACGPCKRAATMAKRAREERVA